MIIEEGNRLWAMGYRKGIAPTRGPNTIAYSPWPIAFFLMRILSAEFIKSCFQAEHFPRVRLPEVAFVGRSNVGKSSLINSLLSRKQLAKVSRTPGKTQAINFYKVDAGGPGVSAFYVVDLPGYGFARVSKTVRAEWGPMIEGYLTNRRELRGVVFLVDARGLGWHDRGALCWLRDLGLPAVVVTTKVDKLTRSERAGKVASVRQGLGLSPEDEVVPYSSVTREGRDVVLKALERMLGERGVRI